MSDEATHIPIDIGENRHTIKIEFSINIQSNLDEIQQIISLINVLNLFMQENIEPDNIAEINLVRLNCDTMVLDCQDNKVFSDSLKQIIYDFHKMKNPQKLSDDHYLKAIFKKIFSLLKEEKLNSFKYLLVNNQTISTVNDIEKIIFNWVSKITAINGKPIAENPYFENLEEIMQIYNTNKDEGFINCLMIGLHLNSINLSHANLKDSILKNIELIKCNLEFCNLEHANLIEANLLGSNLSNCKLNGANLSKAKLLDSNLSESEINSADLNKTVMIGTNLRRSILVNSTLEEAMLARADAFRADLTNCNLKKCNLVSINAIEANFSKADLSYSDLSAARMQGTNITNANLTGVKLLEANLAGISSFEQSVFQQADWWNASIISEDLLTYLKKYYPCTLAEEERVSLHSKTYGKTITDNILKRQHYFLDIKEPEPVQEKEALLSTEEDILNTNIPPETITQEYIDKLANEFLDEPL